MALKVQVTVSIQLVFFDGRVMHSGITLNNPRLADHNIYSMVAVRKQRYLLMDRETSLPH